MVARVDYSNSYTGTTAYDIAYDDGELESDVAFENIRVMVGRNTNPPGVLALGVVEKEELDTVHTPIIDHLVTIPQNEPLPQQQQQQQPPSQQNKQPILTTSLSQSVLAGENRLQVASQTGCAIGMVVQIGSLGGVSSLEVRQIVGFGSLVLDFPLVNSYSAGTTVLVYPTDNAPPLTAPGVTGPVIDLTGSKAPVPIADVVSVVKQEPPIVSSYIPQAAATVTAAVAGQPPAVGTVEDRNAKASVVTNAAAAGAVTSSQSLSNDAAGRVPEGGIPSTHPIVTTSEASASAAAGSSAIPSNPTADAVGLAASTEPATTTAPGHHHHGHKAHGPLTITTDDDDEGDDSSGRPDPSAYSPTDSEDSSDNGSEGDDSVHIDGVFQKRKTPQSTLQPEGR